ncbi:hypothetical protein RND81_14G052600 [Saponaria officinalis]|uniref:CCHC-type domain-containing protein n=1 Tax=Saponaria officinalis TaxID=3572 RepID=A0AAW1GLL3_SAPOF
MPGRPSSKKRKKKAGEGEKKNVKRQKKANKCVNCGELGHYMRTCKKTPVPDQPKKKGGRPVSTRPWAKETREKNEKRRADKEAYARQFGTSTSANPPNIGDALSQASYANPPANAPVNAPANAPASTSNNPTASTSTMP